MSVEPKRTRGTAWRSRAFDAALAATLLGLGLALLMSVFHRRPPDGTAVAVVLLVVHTGSLAWRRRRPGVVLAVNLLTGAAFCALGFPAVALTVATPVALYAVATRLERRRSLLALAATVVVMAATLGLATGNDSSTIAGNAVVLAATWFLGDTQRGRREYVAELEQRTAELEAARGELARQAVAEERLRIAREVHDVVAHSVGMIAVQAGVGRHVIDARPDEAKRALEVIEGASKSALGEIRRLLGLLRSTDDPTETAPSPGLADLPRLAEEVRQTGVEVELSSEQPPGPLPPGLGLTIYRLVQEALTNVVKHAGADHARVAVWFPDGVARVEVVDDGSRSPAPARSGHGIAGMRERVAMHGGTLDVAALPEGGFKVTASIPREEATA